MLYVKMPPRVKHRTAALCYTQYITFLSLHKLTHPSSDIFAIYLVYSVHRNTSQTPLLLLKNTGFYEKARQLLNFCSTLFITPDAKIVSLYMLCLILHCSTWPAQAFSVTHYVNIVFSYSVLFYILVLRFIRYIGLYPECPNTFLKLLFFS